MEEIIKIIVDNGVTVGILCYFAFTNYQFMTRIDTTLANNNKMLETIQNTLEQINVKDNN